MANKTTKTKLFQADNLTPASPATGDSLEEIVNAFLAPLAMADVLDVQYNTSKSGKFGMQPVYTAAIIYKG